MAGRVGLADPVLELDGDPLDRASRHGPFESDDTGARAHKGEVLYGLRAEPPGTEHRPWVPGSGVSAIPVAGRDSTEHRARRSGGGDGARVSGVIASGAAESANVLVAANCNGPVGPAPARECDRRAAGGPRRHIA